MNNLFHQDRIWVGLVVALGSELLTALLLWAGLAIAGVPAAEHLRWFAAIFVAPVLLLRHYAKLQQLPTVTKTVATVLFVTFVLFMLLLFKNGFSMQ